jgi:truncated hemoglobin YjbI
MADILTTCDIEKLVNTFYDNVKKEELLDPIFANRIIDEQWHTHFEKNVLLLGKYFIAHTKL